MSTVRDEIPDLSVRFEPPPRPPRSPGRGRRLRQAVRERRRRRDDARAAAGEHPPNPPRSTERRAGRPSSLLRWFAAVDQDLLETRAEYTRAGAVGLSVLMVAGLAGVSFCVLAWTIAGRFYPWTVAAATLWALVILMVDRSILAEPHYGNLKRAEQDAEEAFSPPAAGARRRRRWPSVRPVQMASILIRICIATITALLIGEALLLLIFRPEIQQQAATAATARYDVAVDRLVADQRTGLEEQIRFATADLAVAKQDEATAKQDSDAAQQAVRDEVAHPDDPGYGPLATIDQENSAAAAGTYQAAQRRVTDLDRQRQRLQRDYADLARDGRPAREKLLAGKSAKQAEAAYQKDLATTGWLEQEAGLRAFEKSSHDVTVQVVPWLVRGLLLLIDLMPVISKLLSSQTIYGRRLRERAYLIRYRDRLLHLVRTDAARAAALTGRESITHVAQLGTDRLGRYQRTRSDHLYRTDLDLDDLLRTDHGGTTTP